MMHIVCDGCGKQEPAQYQALNFHTPWNWYTRTPKNELPIQACSKMCMVEAEAKRKKQNEVPDSEGKV